MDTSPKISVRKEERINSDWAGFWFEFREKPAQDSTFADFRRMINHKVFRGSILVLILINKKLNENVAGVTSTTSLTRFGDLFDVLQIFMFNIRPNSPFRNLKTLANNFVVGHGVTKPKEKKGCHLSIDNNYHFKKVNSFCQTLVEIINFT